MQKIKYYATINIDMARYHKPKLFQKIVGGVGNVGSTAIKIKRVVTHPHEELIDLGSQRLIRYSRRNTGLKGNIRNRKQTYNPKTKKFVKYDTKNHKIVGNSNKPYKRVRRF